MNRRVVITGMGAITPLGNTIEEFWGNIKAGRHGIAPIKKFDTDGFAATLAAEVKEFDAELYFPKKETKRMDLFSQYAVAASQMAVSDSNIDLDKVDRERFGVIIGSGIGGLGTLQEQITKLNDKGPARVAPLFIPMAIVNMAAGIVAIKQGAKGYCTSVVTACASGTNSIGDAFRCISRGDQDYMLAGGTEATITEIGVAGFINLSALSKASNPDRASIPFDKERAGFIMGEGSGVVFMETLESAQARGAHIYAEVVGYGSTCDAYHMTSPDPTGQGPSRAMTMAIKEAGIDPGAVGYINAHGTGTPPNDGAETKAIRLTFKEHADDLYVSSTKSMTGHLLGAAGGIEAIICAMALKDGFIPPTAGLKVADEECDLNYVPGQGIHQDISYALSNSFGFGGHNAVICLKKWGI